MTSLARIWAITRNTFREAIRDKILYSLVFFSILITFLAVVLGQLSLHEEVRLVQDIGLGGISLFSVVIAVFIGSSLVYKELDRKTVFTIIPKPLHRHEFILGKYLGMVLVLSLLLLVMSTILAIVLTLEGASPDAALSKALFLLLIEVFVVAAVAVLFSSFSTPFLSAFFTMGVFVLGRSVPEVKAVAPKLGALGDVVTAAVSLLPDLHLYYVSGGVVGSERVSIHESFVDAAYLGYSTAYGLGYAGVLLLFACIIFRKRDFV